MSDAEDIVDVEGEEGEAAAVSSTPQADESANAGEGGHTTALFAAQI